jgi:hypothetical protein
MFGFVCFKTLFETTVFGYLFDYRMKLAGQYLSGIRTKQYRK